MARSPEILVPLLRRVTRRSATAAILVVVSCGAWAGLAAADTPATAPTVKAAPVPAAHAVKATPVVNAVPTVKAMPTAKAAPVAKTAPAKAAPVATHPTPAPAAKSSPVAAAKPATAAPAAHAAAVPNPHPAPKGAPAAPAARAVVVPKTGAPTVRAASLTGSSAPVVTAVPQNAAAAAANPPHLDDHVTYQYNALGRRDPFQSLVDGAFVGADVGGDAPPDPGGIKVVGIVWGATDQFALVEDVRGNSFVLRKGDKVQNGVVEGLKRDGVIVNITAEGQSQSVEIPLVRKGDQNAR